MLHLSISSSDQISFLWRKKEKYRVCNGTFLYSNHTEHFNQIAKFIFKIWSYGVIIGYANTRRLNIPRNVENDTFYELTLWGNWREREFWTFLRVRWSRNQLQTLHMKFHLGFPQQCQQGGAAAPDITFTSVMMFSTDWKKLSKYFQSHSWTWHWVLKLNQLNMQTNWYQLAVSYMLVAK